MRGASRLKTQTASAQRLAGFEAAMEESGLEVELVGLDPRGQRLARALRLGAVGDGEHPHLIRGVALRTHPRHDLVARLRGRSDGPRLCLLGHVDTVLANPADWKVDPWSGELRDGCVWDTAIDSPDKMSAMIRYANENRGGSADSFATLLRTLPQRLQNRPPQLCPRPAGGRASSPGRRW